MRASPNGNYSQGPSFFYFQYIVTIQWDESFWILGDVTVKRLPQFELCSGDEEGGSKFFLFPDPFNFHFYNRMCDNLGGLMPMPV